MQLFFFSALEEAQMVEHHNYHETTVSGGVQGSLLSSSMYESLRRALQEVDHLFYMFAGKTLS